MVIAVKRSLVRSVTAPLAAALAAWSAPDLARACSTVFCYDTGAFGPFSVANETLRTNGVLLIASQLAPGRHLTVEEAQALVDIVVTNEAGDEVKGTFDGVPGAYVWRPLDPLTVGEVLTVDFAVSEDNCFGPDEGSTTVTVIPAATPPLPSATVTFEQEYYFDDRENLDNVVCCNGAYPSTYCDRLDFEGYCAVAAGTGYAQATLTIEDFDPAFAATTRIDLVVDGKVVESRSGPNIPGRPDFWVSKPNAFEVTTRVVDVATGEELEGDAFIADGDGLGQLGPRPLDVDAELAANCETLPYVCEHDGSDWIKTACTPYWDDEAGSSSGTTDVEPEPTTTDIGTSSGSGGDAAAEDAAGCACTGGGFPANSSLMLLGLLGLRPRSSKAPRPN